MAVVMCNETSSQRSTALDPSWKARHVWVSRKWLPQYRGCRLRVLVSRNGKFLVEFEDGTKVVTVRGTFRKIAGGGKAITKGRENQETAHDAKVGPGVGTIKGGEEGVRNGL